MNKATITRNQAIEKLCASGEIYELNSTQINDRNVKVFKNAPKTLNELYFSNSSDLDFIVYQDERYTFSQILGFQLKFKNNGLLTVITGSINGVLGGIAGIWGPLTVSYLMSLKIEKNEQIKVQGIMYSLGSIFLLLGHLYSGIFNKYTFSLSLSLVPLCIVGLFIGSIIRNKIKQTTFKTFTLVMILLASINLIRKAFL